MHKHFSIAKDRIKLTLEVHQIGPDLFCFLTGGSVHIGATAICTTNMSALDNVLLVELPKHREGQLAKLFAFRLSKYYHCTVQVTVGIHYNNITKAEIAQVLELAERLLDDVCL